MKSRPPLDFSGGRPTTAHELQLAKTPARGPVFSHFKG
jgi:hypothetical protein